MMDKYSAHNAQKRIFMPKRKKVQSEFARQHKNGLISGQYENVYKLSRY